MKIKVWSETAQREFSFPNIYSLEPWIPSIELIMVTVVTAILLTYLRKYIQDVTYKVRGFSFWRR